MKNSPFYRVEVEIVEKLGLKPAFLLAVLKNTAKIWKKDDQGRFAVWNSYLLEKTGFSRRTLERVREKLVEAGLISFEKGTNQNVPVKYKIVK